MKASSIFGIEVDNLLCGDCWEISRSRVERCRFQGF